MKAVYFALALFVAVPASEATAQAGPDPEETVTTSDDDHNWSYTRRWTRPLIYETTLPYNESGIGGQIPPVRYNRVEGLVLGIRAPEFDADDWERAKPVGQLAYAFALGGWRYDAGFEVRPFADFASLAGLKVGLRYRFNTTTDDAWKAPWGENSLAALVFRNDFFDYYETQGWSVYTGIPLGRRIQLSAGYRSEEHRSLENETSWSIFGDGPFRINPSVDEGLIRSFVAAIDAGHIRYRLDRPVGNALRIEYETASDAIGSDLNYWRLTADARTYGKLTRHSTYAVRVRAGYADEDAVFQKLFTVGGVGTVRGYPINILRADRVVMGNLEYGLTDVDLILDDIDLFGFADAAWTSTSAFETRDEEILASAGVGIGLAGRKIRLELAFPLNDVGTGLEPSLWFRLYPQF